MRTLYLDCGMGAAGDMLTAALLELFEDKEKIVAELNEIGIPGVEYVAEKCEKCGIWGTHVSVKINGEEEAAFHHHHEHGHGHDHEHHHHHDHSGMGEISHLIGHLKLNEKVRGDVLAVYNLIAQAESHVHGEPVEQIHFHEVGTMDAVADVTAVCYLLDRLGVQKVAASAVHVGSGKVCCAHGVLPVPAPATAYILRQVPIYGGSITGELCTPTGAALLKHFVSNFGEMPPMAVEAIGYGMGKKDFAAANCVRAMLGSTQDRGDVVVELSCNLDDMTGEELGFAMEQLLAAGALDVWTQAIGMKKCRPGVQLCVLCHEEQRQEMIALLFRHTTTLGVRETEHRRWTLDRRMESADTAYGQVRQKVVSGYGVERRKAEFDDLARIAREQGISLREAKKLVK